VIQLIDPLSGQMAQLSGDAFWRDPLRPIITAARSRMMRFVVLGKEAIVLERNVSKRAASKKQRNRLASLTLAREDDLGINDKQFDERSNVGYLMKAGDVCVGYDLTETQLVDDDAESTRASGKLPDVVVIRKLYGGVAAGEADAAKKRLWRLQRLDVEVAESMKSARAAKLDADADDMDEEDFMREVEADRDMRSQMNLYKSEHLVKKKLPILTSMDEDGAESVNPDEDDDQQIKLEELLDGLVVDDGPDPEDATDMVPSAEEEGDLMGLEEGEKAAKDGITYHGREEARQLKAKEGAVAKSTFGKDLDLKDFKFI
jgi:nonsense-mediated mRNA decay protein 3